MPRANGLSTRRIRRLERPLGRQVRLGGAGLRAARLGRRRAGRRSRGRDDPEPDSEGGTPALIWAHPDATEAEPDARRARRPRVRRARRAPDAARPVPPLRATLLGPVDRDEIYSAFPRYARALADEILPALPPAPQRIGLGASLGALALFHAHRRHPEASTRSSSSPGASSACRRPRTVVPPL